MDQILEDAVENAAVEETPARQLNEAEEARIKSLMEIGAFYGLSKSRTNPKMRPYIVATRSGVEVIDLEKTVEALDKAAEVLKAKARSGGTILFVGTTPAAKNAVKSLADELQMPYVTERWLGGTLTNFRVISQRISQLRKLKEDQEGGRLEKYTKKERFSIMKELERLDKFFHGLFYLDRIPTIAFVVDLKNNTLAAREARKAGVAVIATVNTNANPDLADYAIPVNDKSVQVIDNVIEVVGRAIKEGRKEFESAAKQEEVKNEQ